MAAHPEMNERYELYVLGVLEPEGKQQIEQHLREGCADCLRGVEKARVLTASLAGLAPLATPPAELRERTLRTIAGAGRSLEGARKPTNGQRWWWAGLAAALALVAVALGVERQQLQQQLSQAQGERNQLRAAVQSLSRNETRTAQFGRAEEPHGRVFVGSEGRVLLVASNLPALTNGRTFELWLVPKAGAPRAAGLFRANAQGDSVQFSEVAVGSDTAAVAVSVEPSGGSAAPSSKPIIVAPLGG